MTGQIGLMEASAYFIALVIFSLLNIAYAQWQKQQGVKEVNRQIDDPQSPIGQKMVDVEQKSIQKTEGFLERYAKDEIEGQKKRARELEVTLNGYMERMDTLTERMTQVEDENVRLKKQAEDNEEAAQTRKEEYNRRISDLESAHTKQVTGLQGEVQSLTARMKLLEDENTAVKAERDQARKELRDVKETLIRVQAENHALMLVFERINVIRVETKSPDDEQKPAEQAPPAEETPPEP